MCAERSFVAQKGLEMTELVTIKVAQEAQLSLLAQRPQAQTAERTQAPIQITGAEVNPDVQRAPNQAEGASTENGGDFASDQNRSNSQAELTGPSRARVQVRDFDVGKTPAEVVGTRDVVARFDTNDDGRIDLVEAQRSARARDDGGASSFRGLATSRADPAPAEAPAQIQPKVENKPAQTEEPKQKFGTTENGDVISQKKFTPRTEGGEGAPEPQKFFGKGPEAALGQFAAPTEQPQKFSDRAAVVDRGAGETEAASGERKYYDKVSESDAGNTGSEDPQQQQSQTYYERARELAAYGTPAKEPAQPEPAVVRVA
jgi:hypothetical protein